jgi:hypothetical protein
MATNPAADYGIDILAVRFDPVTRLAILGADEFFSDATGLAIVRQDALHRILTDDVLGPGGQGWGRDVRRLLGSSTLNLAAQQPIFAEVLQRDPRIERADVTITSTTNSAGIATISFTAVCTTDAGPFELIIPDIANLSSDTIERQGA